MSRTKLLEKIIFDALGNATLSTTGLVQNIHGAHPDVKNVALVRYPDMREFTIHVVYHDRDSDTFSFARNF